MNKTMKRILTSALTLLLAFCLSTTTLAFEWTDNTGGVFPVGEEYVWLGIDGAGVFYSPESLIFLPLPLDQNISDYLGDNSARLKDLLKVSHEITKGSALVEWIKWVKTEVDGQEAYQLCMKIKPNFTIIDLKAIEGVVTITAKQNAEGTIEGNPDDTGGGTSYTISKGDRWEILIGGESGFPIFVANGLEEVDGAKKADDADVYTITGVERDHIVYMVGEDNDPGYVKFNDTNSLFQITAKMNRDEKLHMHLEENDEDVLDALEALGVDPGIDLFTYTLCGRISFQNPARFTLQGDFAEPYFIYAFDGAALAPVDAGWNSQDGLFEWYATEMLTYVISPVELLPLAPPAA